MVNVLMLVVPLLLHLVKKAICRSIKLPEQVSDVVDIVAGETAGTNHLPTVRLYDDVGKENVLVHRHTAYRPESDFRLLATNNTRFSVNHHLSISINNYFVGENDIAAI